MSHRFRFGVLVSDVTSASRLHDDARKIEGLGYSTALVPDHLAVYTPFAPLPVALSMANATSTLRVGTMVLANDLRHPALLARDVATIDVCSDGRFELGIGAGWLRRDYDAAGIPYDAFGTRVERLAESLSVLKRLLEGDCVTHRGRHYTIDELDARPKTVQRPRPPILVGGGSRAALELAAREADIVGVAPRMGLRAVDVGGLALRVQDAHGPATTDEQLEWVRAAAGFRFDQLELQMFPMIVYVTPHREHLAEQLGAPVGLSEPDFLASSLALVGTVDEIADELVARRERWGISYVVVPQVAADAFAPVVGRLAGT
ncbi:MAG TPA: TIGR03621 family F420-dependent LLM class oxidoreductase [Acidimicrobiia bacterium]|nr:TIGR03621 family F420-dependent LLM class oxidoreductase [Acidimicrobiia bacterium]